MSSEYRQDDQQQFTRTGDPARTSTPPPYSGVADESGVPRTVDVPPAGAYDPASRGAYGVGPVPGAPNPGLAALLGFIPGVGAMYNGQFAKGIAHIAIFAIFCSLSKNVNGIFGLFIAGWVLYMAFEAYQTAIARRDGLPLPDPFGLNTIGERFGFRANPTFNSFWAGGAPPPPAGSQVPPGHYPPYAVPPASFHVDPTGTAYGPGATPYGYPQPDPSRPPYAQAAGYGAYPPPPPPPVTPYGAAGYDVSGMPPPMPVMPPVRGSGLPAGALWLIGLGFFALLGSIRAFDFLEGEATGGIFLIGLSFFLVWRHWNTTRVLYPQGSPASPWGIVLGARGAWILFVVGLLTLLQGLRLAYWENSWPFLLIAIGVVLLLERLALNQMTPLTGTPPAAPPVQPGHVSDTSILPRFTPAAEDTTSREGQ